MAQDLLRIGLFTAKTVVTLADVTGFFRSENIFVDIRSVTDSPTLMRNLISGKYDLILANVDNVIGWAEGEGADPQKQDLIFFLGGARGVNQKLVVARGIDTFSDLCGGIIAVDAPTTGYATVGVFILKAYGLEHGQDYQLKSFGNTAARAEALTRGDAAGAMMGMADDEIEARGFKILARADDYVKHYARGLGATRRQWANRNKDLVVGFIRAMIRATDWILNPQNKQDVIRSLLEENHSVITRAERLYEEILSAKCGLTPRSAIDMEAIRSVIELRKAAGFMRPFFPEPEKYVDEHFYGKAVATLDSVKVDI